RHTRFSRDWSSDVCSSDLALTTQIGYRPFGRPTHASHFDVAVVRGQENSKSLVMEQTEKIPQETLPGPLPNLVVHPRRPQLHAEIGRASCRERVRITVGAS